VSPQATVKRLTRLSTIKRKPSQAALLVLMGILDFLLQILVRVLCTYLALTNVGSVV
jgi:hypothetical protein